MRIVEQKCMFVTESWSTVQVICLCAYCSILIHKWHLWSHGYCLNIHGVQDGNHCWWLSVFGECFLYIICFTFSIRLTLLSFSLYESFLQWVSGRWGLDLQEAMHWGSASAVTCPISKHIHSKMSFWDHIRHCNFLGSTSNECF